MAITIRGSTVLKAAITEFERLAKEWKEEARKLRAYPGGDTHVVADTFDLLARRVLARCQALDSGSEYLTIEQYAEHVGKSKETIRRWVRSKEPEAYPSGRTVRIPRNAKRRKHHA